MGNGEGGGTGKPSPGGSHLALEGERQRLAQAAAHQDVVELVQGGRARGWRRGEEPQGAHPEPGLRGEETPVPVMVTVPVPVMVMVLVLGPRCRSQS